MFSRAEDHYLRTGMMLDGNPPGRAYRYTLLRNIKRKITAALLDINNAMQSPHFDEKARMLEQLSMIMNGRGIVIDESKYSRTIVPRLDLNEEDASIDDFVKAMENENENSQT